MKPNLNNTRPRRRPDLPLPEPQTAAPRPLPPSSNPMSNQHQHYHLSDLDRVNRIGSGSWGTVHKVIHRPTATHFALKLIYGKHDDDIHREILHQIKILQGIDNLNIVKCHDHMVDSNGQIHVLLEYMDSGSLRGTHMSDESKLADVTRQILSGLHYLHVRNIVHGHIKPSNLLINSEKQVKISVSGVTRILEQTTHSWGRAVGTIAYLSPARINTDLNQGKYDAYAGDIWSMGVCILEIYMGVLPFEVSQDDWASLMCAICMSPPPQAPVTASREFQDFVGCCLQKDPGKRWTAAQLLGHPFVTGAAVVDVSTTTISLEGACLPADKI